MAEFRYRAYISYSHKDEPWATWVHRSLESYRVPRHLLGSQTNVGEVPDRFKPVFRDRDDLSSSTDLKDTVKKALADSENLVVVCSPAAAASHWVNEEIRQFAALGRADRIFCIIVDGAIADDGSVSNCFPAALAEIGLEEPLAADVRKWADGKHVARLKLIAGLLGIRLDELRQRDLQRKRKRQLLGGMAIVAAVALAVMTVIAQISEQHEREKAEQLATFIVDLGERLQSDADLETLALISAEASRHLESLDPDKLSPETGKKVALAFRQVGQVSQFEGKPGEALEAFRRSRDLLSGLTEKYPDNQQLLFELGNAEYYIGNLFFDLEEFDDALASWQNYHSLTRRLVESDPANPDWILELSYSHNNLAALQLGSGRGINADTLEHVAEAIRLMEQVVALRPGAEDVVSNYATTLAWAADAQFQSCKLTEALALRQQVLELSEFATRKDPGNNDMKEQFAYALTGVARVQRLLGRSMLARQNLEAAISILGQLMAADPAKIKFREQMIYRQIMLAGLLADTSQLEAAGFLLEQIKPAMELGDDLAVKSGLLQREYVNFALVYANMYTQMGDVDSAKESLQKVSDIQSHRSNFDENDIYNAQRNVNTRYLWWRLTGQDQFGYNLKNPTTGIGVREFRSCTEADSAARIFVMEGAINEAISEVAYLQSNGYADPGFLRFCEYHGLCER